MKNSTIIQVIMAIAAAALLIRPSLAEAAGFEYDLLIKNGRVFDGSLQPAFPADVAVKDGVIVKIARPITGTAARTIDAKGLFITPGFIDLHIHVEVGMDALERKAVSLEHVIRSQTSLAAQIMNLPDRGWIKEGYKADINVIDLNNIRIKATIANPSRYCEGVEYLIVNGKVVIDKGKWNGTLAGQVLKLNK
jgi:N-acyl-D-aspartate/D-glutamate deacylase